MSPYSNLESGSSGLSNGTASRRALATSRSSSPHTKVNGTNKTRRKNGVIASPLRKIRRDNNNRDLISLSIIRFVLALLILIWFGVMVKLISNLSASSSSSSSSSSNNMSAEQSAAMHKLSEKWKNLRFNKDGTIGTVRGVKDSKGEDKGKDKDKDSSSKKKHEKVEEPKPEPIASIFELSLLGNTSPSDFRLTTPNAPSCSEPIDAESISFTLVSQLSHDRIWMLPYHCKRWGDNPMSIVIFTDEDAAVVKNKLVIEGCSKEHLTVQTVSKTRYDPQGTDYPVNVLRNLAFSKVKTTHLVYADIDFWPKCEGRMASDSKLATVVPVFQMNRRCRAYKDCRDDNIPFMPKRKDELIGLIKKRQASTFDPTNEGGTAVLDISLRYCSELPPFQEGFSGYGKNKMTWAMQLRRSGYQFSQLGEAFLVHYPHLDSKSRLDGIRNQRSCKSNIDLLSYKRARVDALFLDYKDWLRDNVTDSSRVPMCENALNDDVRLWVHRDAEDESEDSESEDNDDGNDVVEVNEELAKDTEGGAQE
ncbi:glycosyltransferase [Skeletonema marinoi]|uniref:Glycosyltransferase n=1 Tax=Skeletonema marinoi TaxID=267567 RepID=A0AAD8YN93_9STRA|nr:glycosyltransferase [Skeletonema marinoi]